MVKEGLDVRLEQGVEDIGNAILLCELLASLKGDPLRGRENMILEDRLVAYAQS